MVVKLLYKSNIMLCGRISSADIQYNSTFARVICPNSQAFISHYTRDSHRSSMQMVLIRKPFDCGAFLDDKSTVRWYRLVKRRNVHLCRNSRQAIPPQPHRGGVSGHCPLALTGTARTMGALCPGLSGMHCGRHEGVVREPLIRSSSLTGVCRVGKPILWYFCLCASLWSKL